MKLKVLAKTVILTGVTASLLQSCIFVAGAAAGAAAIAVVYDHRTIAKTLQDTRIANRVSHNINALYLGHRGESHIVVTVFNRIVLLTGQAPNAEVKQQAEQTAKSIPGVEKVYNQLTVEGPTSTLTRTSDTWITAKIKSQMLAAEDLKSGSIKVVTENGVVYLMGNVNPTQATMAVEIARRVSGVQKVIKIFQYNQE